jgi:IstB-like ATP binding protein
VPISVFDSFTTLNAHLETCCRRRMSDRLRGHTETIGERLERDVAALHQPLPPPYDASEKVPATERSENIIALGNSGAGKSHIALGLGLAACQRGLSVGFTAAAAIVHELMEARDEKRLLRLQRQLAAYKLLIVDELGVMPEACFQHDAVVANRRRAAVRGVLPALWARLHHRHQQPALRRVDKRVRRRAPHRCSPRPVDPPRPHPRDER